MGSLPSPLVWKPGDRPRSFPAEGQPCSGRPRESAWTAPVPWSGLCGGSCHPTTSRCTLGVLLCQERGSRVQDTKACSSGRQAGPLPASTVLRAPGSTFCHVDVFMVGVWGSQLRPGVSFKGPHWLSMSSSSELVTLSLLRKQTSWLT